MQQKDGQPEGGFHYKRVHRAGGGGGGAAGVERDINGLFKNIKDGASLQGPGDARFFAATVCPRPHPPTLHQNRLDLDEEHPLRPRRIQSIHFIVKISGKGKKKNRLILSRLANVFRLACIDSPKHAKHSLHAHREGGRAPPVGGRLELTSFPGVHASPRHPWNGRTPNARYLRARGQDLQECLAGADIHQNEVNGVAVNCVTLQRMTLSPEPLGERRWIVLLVVLQIHLPSSPSVPHPLSLISTFDPLTNVTHSLAFWGMLGWLQGWEGGAGGEALFPDVCMRQSLERGFMEKKTKSDIHKYRHTQKHKGVHPENVA